jgi:uncharacterized protein YdaU (DUF1376 family)
MGENRAERIGVSAPSAPLTDPDAERGSDDMADADSTPGKSPAFQFYPKDFITDERVTLMSMQERGVYITLICKCWTEGTLPADLVLLARLCGFPTAAFRKCWTAIAPCFRPCSRDASRLIHPRLEKERQKQRAYRRRQADNGKLGGRPPKPKPNPSLLQKPAETQRVANPLESSAFASSSSSSDSGQKREARVTGGVMAGSLPRDHVNCRQPCIRVCLTEKQHAILRERHGGTDADLDAFYADVRGRLEPGVPIGETPWKFWDAQFAAKFGAAVAVNPRTAGNAAAAARFVARRQG